MAKGTQDEAYANLPLILGLETATPISSVALFRGPHLWALSEHHGGRDHARLITQSINRMLDEKEASPKDLAAVCVASGPGSYTGLRVGVSTAKGLCMALGIPLLAVNSLQSLAHLVTELAQAWDAVIVPMIDARRMEVYTQTFNAQGQALSDPEALIVEEDSFADLLKHQRVIFLGDGAEKCKPLLEKDPHALVLGHSLSSAKGLGVPAYQRFEAQQFEDLTRFEPFYLKDFVAKKPKDLV